MTSTIRADIGLVRYECEKCGCFEEVPHEKATRRRRRCCATFPMRGDARCDGTAVRVNHKPRRTSHRDTLSCSFCGVGQREARKLIAGPLTYICDDCVLLSYEIVLEQDGLPPVPTNYEDPVIRAVRAKTARELAATYEQAFTKLMSDAEKWDAVQAPLPEGHKPLSCGCDDASVCTCTSTIDPQQRAQWRVLAEEAAALPRESVNGPALARIITELLDVIEARK